MVDPMFQNLHDPGKVRSVGKYKGIFFGFIRQFFVIDTKIETQPLFL